MMKTMKYVLLGFFSLITLSAFSNDEQTNNSVNNTTNSDNLFISVYSGVGDVNFGLGCTKGIGTEWTYKNASVNLGFGRGVDDYGGEYTGTSMGVKIYNSGDINKSKVFVGFNHINAFPDYSYRHYYDNTITVGCKCISSSGIYMSPYVGIRQYGFPECFGLNIGYQFEVK